MSNIASLYPSVIHPEDGHPTSDRFFVTDTDDERGKGLRGKVAFAKDEHVAKLSGVIMDKTTLDTIQITPTLYFADRWFCRFLLHSCDPNLEINLDHLFVRALRDIPVGEYLTIDYADTDDEVTCQFACNCLAENCRRWITGRAQEINEEGRQYLRR